MLTRNSEVLSERKVSLVHSARPECVSAHAPIKAKVREKVETINSRIQAEANTPVLNRGETGRVIEPVGEVPIQIHVEARIHCVGLT